MYCTCGVGIRTHLSSGCCYHLFSFCLSFPAFAALQLPDAVTLHLHVIKDCVYAYDYSGCLQNVNAMVSGGSFATLADFLPGIKVLVQVAMQLGIYLERQ